MRQTVVPGTSVSFIAGELFCYWKSFFPISIQKFLWLTFLFELIEKTQNWIPSSIIDTYSIYSLLNQKIILSLTSIWNVIQ